MTSDVGMEDPIAENARMSLIFSEIGRLMDMPPGSLPENVQLRVEGLVQEVAELTGCFKASIRKLVRLFQLSRRRFIE
jgi:hypothetical protein